MTPRKNAVLDLLKRKREQDQAYRDHLDFDVEPEEGGPIEPGSFDLTPLLGEIEP